VCGSAVPNQKTLLFFICRCSRLWLSLDKIECGSAVPNEKNFVVFYLPLLSPLAIFVAEMV
jgi:hypothetical protein